MLRIFIIYLLFLFFFLILLDLLGLVTFSFSIYIFFGRNWWSRWDLFCLVLIRTVLFRRSSCHDSSFEVVPLLPQALWLLLAELA